MSVDLKRMLSSTNAKAFEGLTFDHAPIAKEIEALKEWVADTASPKPALDLILEALRRFHGSLTVSRLRDAQLVCYGCIEPFDEEKKSLIDDGRHFPILLNSVDQYRTNPRAFRRCYRGLLSGYFGYNPYEQGTSQGKRNWQLLRTYLQERVGDITCSAIEPDWVRAVVDHKNLLTENPCSRYGSALINGDDQEFKRAKRDLDITDASWVLIRLISARVDMVIAGTDAPFFEHLPHVLDLLQKHRLVLNDELAKVLERCRKSKGIPTTHLLRDFAVAHWGIPWLASNEARWGRVSESARRMVADWLKLDLLQQFFSLLAEDGANDKRRLEFWERYVDRIDDMYFALGSHARTNRSRDFIELPKKMSGRVLELQAGGVPRNNAFIMRIGDHIVVEFGVRNNACFIFDRAHLPFNLNRQSVAGDRTELKHDRHVERLLHKDGTNGLWEEQFEQRIRQLTRVRPRLGRTEGCPSSELLRGACEQSGTGGGPPPYTREKLDRFASNRGLKLRDFTGQKGNLWVSTDESDPSVNRQLSDWGFRYKPNKGWWREI